MSRHVAIITLALSLSATSVDASNLYNAPPNFPGAYNAWASQVDEFGESILVLDNVQLANPVSIELIQWQGLYVSEDPADNPPAPVAISFAVVIFADLGGAPDLGNLVFASFFNLGAGLDLVDEVFLADDPNFLFEGSNTPTTAALYNYSLQLSTPVGLGAGSYWITIIAETLGEIGLPFWAWTSGGDTPDATSLQIIGDDTFVRDRDRALALGGAVVPEPSTLALAGIGLAALAVMKARRRGRLAP